jgi:hypothetical protein
MKATRSFVLLLLALLSTGVWAAADYTTFLTAARGFTEVTNVDAMIGDADYYYILTSAENNSLIVGVGRYESKPGWASEDTKALRYRSADTDPILDLTNFFTIEKNNQYVGLRNMGKGEAIYQLPKWNVLYFFFYNQFLSYCSIFMIKSRIRDKLNSGNRVLMFIFAFGKSKKGTAWKLVNSE